MDEGRRKVREYNAEFRKTVDELVIFSEYDPELGDGLRWMDAEAQKRGISIYEMVFSALYKHDIEKASREWVGEKSAGYGRTDGGGRAAGK